MTCKFGLPNLALDLHGAVGYLHNGDSPMICGGFSNQLTSYRPECYLLNNVETWVPVTGFLKTNLDWAEFREIFGSREPQLIFRLMRNWFLSVPVVVLG